MRRLLMTAAIAALALLALPISAQAKFGIDDFDVTYTNEDGTPDAQAGSHPFEMTTSFEVHNHPNGKGSISLDEASRDILTAQITGLGGNPFAVPTCPSVDFLTLLPNSNGPGTGGPNCPSATALGTIGIGFNGVL